jgi:protein-tyrosine-phosphatase/DNA-binding transcriptional ArsR family regulator
MDINKALLAFGALSQETRLRVFRMLVEYGPDGVPAGALSDALDIPHNTLSFHLNHMSHSGLVLSRREGRSIIYSANFEFFTGLIRYMVEDCCRVEFANIRDDKKRGCSVIELSNCCLPKEETSRLMQKVLVLCTGNSCRSVMAEALFNHLGKGRYLAMSAGSFPAGHVHPKSIETLKRHGIDPGNPRSKSWDEFAGQSFDLVVTVCDRAAGESCPVFLGSPEKLHWSTLDPAKATGTEAEIDAAFDQAFALLKDRVEEFVKA